MYLRDFSEICIYRPDPRKRRSQNYFFGYFMSSFFWVKSPNKCQVQLSTMSIVGFITMAVVRSRYDYDGICKHSDISNQDKCMKAYAKEFPYYVFPEILSRC